MTNDQVTVTTVYADRQTNSAAVPPAPSAASQIGVALLALVAVGLWWLGIVIGAFVLEIFDFQLGRVVGVCAAGAGVLVALVNVPLTKRLPKPGCVAIALAGGLLFASVAIPAVPPGYYAMRSELRRLDPPGWKLLDELRGGNSICFDVCTSVTRMLEPNTHDMYDAERTINQILRRSGYRQVERTYSGGRVFRKGKLKVTSYEDAGFPASPGYPGRPPGWTLQIEAS